MTQAETIKEEVPKPASRKMNFNEKREFEQIEKEIPTLEKEKSEVELAMSDASLSYDALQKLSNRITEIINLLSQKEARWLELSELSEQ